MSILFVRRYPRRRKIARKFENCKCQLFSINSLPMKYSQTQVGRAFVIRLEDGDVLHTSIEQFAADNNISTASLIVVGGADAGSRLIVGPADGRASPVLPMDKLLDDVHEVSGVGTLFPDSKGRPVLHMHIACGRKDQTVTGCVRRGVKVWHVMEVVLFELVGSSARRIMDTVTGFELLET